MVAIGNKSNLDGNLSILKPKSSQDNVDMLFAELFSLINFNEENEQEQINTDILAENNNQKTKSEFNNDNNTVDVAKSLAQIFYKELGISDSNRDLENITENRDNVDGNYTTTGEDNFKGKKEILSTTNILSSEKMIRKGNNHSQPKELHGQTNTFTMVKENLNKNNQGKEILITVRKEEINKTNKLNETLNLIKPHQKRVNKEKLHIEKTDKLDETKQNNLNHTSMNKSVKNSKEFFAHSTEKKNSIKTKNNKEKDLEKEEESKILPKNRNVDLKSTTNGNLRVIELKKKPNASFKTELNKNNEVLEKKVLKNYNSSFNNQQTLDLMESSWGDKFAKLVKNTINNGLNRVELYLKPKNLGKISLEVAVKNNKTEIFINAETQEATNLLNENISRMTEVLDERNNRFSGQFNNQGNNSFSQNNQSNKQNTDNYFGKKKDNITTKKIKENNHNVDVQA